MLLNFIHIRILDFVDVFLVALLLYQLYQLIKNTVAMRIFTGILFIYFFWLLVKFLKMKLLTVILGQVMGVGVIALLIVFQQEIRRFLLIVGSRYFSRNSKFSLDYLLSGKLFQVQDASKKAIIESCWNLAKTKTGALIVLSNRSELKEYVDTGDAINADINTNLIENIFFKNAPLHDGAMIIVDNKIKAVRCTLPILDTAILPSHFGMRHKTALSMNLATDSLVLIVSEETGKISYAWKRELKTISDEAELKAVLDFDF